MNIEQAITSYHHQTNVQVKACITVIKCTIKKYLDTYKNVNLVLLQIRSMPIGAGFPVLPCCYSIEH